MQSADLNVVIKRLVILLQYLVSQNILRHSSAVNACAQYSNLLEEMKNAFVGEREFFDEFSFKKVSCYKNDVISHVMKVLLTIMGKHMLSVGSHKTQKCYKRILKSY